MSINPHMQEVVEEKAHIPNMHRDSRLCPREYPGTVNRIEALVAGVFSARTFMMAIAGTLREYTHARRWKEEEVRGSPKPRRRRSRRRRRSMPPNFVSERRGSLNV